MKLKRDIITGIVGIVAVVLGITATQFIKLRPNLIEPGPRMMPYVALAIILISSVMLLLHGIREQKEEKPYFPEGGVKRLLIGYAEIFLYGILLTVFGFLLTTPCAMFAFIYTLKGDEKVKWWQNLLISLTVTAFLYAMFVLGFQIKLPAGIVFK